MAEKLADMDPAQARQFQLIEYSEPARQSPGGGAPGGGSTYTPEGQPVDDMPGGGMGMPGAMIVGPLFKLAFGIMAERRGEHWRLTQAEEEELARAGGAVMDYYVSATPGPIAGLALAMGVAVGPRILEERRILQEERRDKAKRTGEGDTDGN